MNKTFIALILLFCINPTINSQNIQSKHDSILDIMNKVCSWQMNEWKEGKIMKLPKTEWENASLYTGILSLQHIVNDPAIDTFLYQIGEECNWNTGPHRFFADDYCIAQMYTSMYLKYKDDKMIYHWKELADSIVSAKFDKELNVVPNLHFQEWSWCDALYMGPPSLAILSFATNDSKYIIKADSLWWKTTDFLYSKNDSLFYRDSRFFTRKEANGKKVFWSRGNSWVVAGIVHMLDYMPKKFHNRNKYIQLYSEMCAKIGSLQQPDGSWHSSLYDPLTFNQKESSSTGFFCYAIAWGINNNILSKKKYLPIVQKAWKSLLTCVHPNGKLGFVQNIGDKPVSATYESTNVYGVGSFLLAGSEIYKIIRSEK